MEDNQEKMENEKEQGLGHLLAGEREKKGLSLQNVAEITKLRKQFIKALEMEDWDSLPAPVFVRGFIRSYASAIGFDANEAMNLYEKLFPTGEEVPKPLVESQDSKNRAVFILIPLFLLIALGFYLWTADKIPFLKNNEIISTQQEEKIQEVPVPVQDTSKTAIPEEQEKKVPGEIKDMGTNVKIMPEKASQEKAAEPPSAEVKEPDESVAVVTGTHSSLSEQRVPGPQPEPEAEPEVKAETGTDTEQEIQPEIKPASEPGHEQEPKPDQESLNPPLLQEPDIRPILSSEPVNLVPGEGEMLLTGIVSERTYVRIFVDDNKPKEYIFRPGSRPQWIAKEGFYLVIGNASGIEFEFDGKRIKDLGRAGKVIRVSFPEDFKSHIYED